MGVESLFGTHRAAIPIQLFAMIGSAAFAANEIRKLTRSTLFGIATLALVIGNIFIYRYAFTIITEALFFSAIAVLTGLICRFAGSPSRGIIGAMSLLIAVSILIRPASYIFIVVLAACAAIQFINEQHRTRLALHAVLPLALMLFAGSAIYYGHHGSFRTQSFLGHNLIGKTAYISGRDATSQYPEIVRLVDEYMKPMREVEFDALQDRYLFRLPHYDFVRGNLTVPAVEHLATTGVIGQDAIRQEVAFSVFKSNPVGFAKEVALQLYALWTVADLWTAKDNRRFSQFIDSLAFDPFKGMKTPRRKPMPWVVVYGVRAFVLLVFVLTVGCLGYVTVALARRKSISSTWTALALLSLMAHAYFLLIATLQVGYFRYFVVIWPAIIAIFTVALAAFATPLAARIKPKSA